MILSKYLIDKSYSSGNIIFSPRQQVKLAGYLLSVLKTEWAKKLLSISDLSPK